MTVNTDGDIVLIKVAIVEFDPNGGIVDPEKLLTKEDGRLEYLPSPKMDNYIFTGWYTAIDGGEKITLDYYFPTDTKLYA